MTNYPPPGLDGAFRRHAASQVMAALILAHKGQDNIGLDALAEVAVGAADSLIEALRK